MPAEFSLPSWALPLLFGALGACIGSFLNVVIYRIPRGLSVNEPRRSFCPTCKQLIPWYNNIPIFSWLILCGKSACCHTKITFRYCFVELACALLCASVAYHHPLAPLPAQLALVLWLVMAIVVIFIDAEHMLVYRSQTIIGTMAGLIAGAFYPLIIPLEEISTWTDALYYSGLGAAGGFMLMWLTAWLGKLAFGSWKKDYTTPVPWTLEEAQDENDEMKIIIDNNTTHGWSELFYRDSDKAHLCGGELIINDTLRLTGDFTLYVDKIQVQGTDKVFLLADIRSAHGTLCSIQANREAMGSGDAWIMMMIGAIGSWPCVIFSLFTGAILGLIYAVLTRIGFGKNIPFGPALLTAAIIWLLGGSQWWDAYLRFLSE